MLSDNRIRQIQINLAFMTISCGIALKECKQRIHLCRGSKQQYLRSLDALFVPEQGWIMNSLDSSRIENNGFGSKYTPREYK